MRASPTRNAVVALGLAGLTMANALAVTPPRSGTGQADLMLVIWDSVAQVSYTQSVLPRTTNATQFWIDAQQDKGYTFALELDASNTALSAFRSASTNTANQSWALFGFEQGFSLNPGVNKVYSTLTQGPGNGVTNPNWVDMTSANYTVVLGLAFNINANNKLYGALSTPATSGLSLRPDGSYYSSFDRLGSSGYFAGQTGFSAQGGSGNGSFLAGTYNVANAVGKSSWFYYITNAAGSDIVAVDEFDNLGYNGYWGLALTSADKYLLTYTLPAANTPKTSANTEAGLQRVAVTDFAAGTGDPRWIGWADTVSPVPETGTVPLLLAGLALLAVRRRSAAA